MYFESGANCTYEGEAGTGASISINCTANGSSAENNCTTYNAEEGTEAPIQPNKLNFNDKENISINCTNGTSVEPNCTPDNKNAGTKAATKPNKLQIENKENITINCTDGTSTEHTCSNGTFTPAISLCDTGTSTMLVSYTMVPGLSTKLAVMSAFLCVLI